MSKGIHVVTSNNCYQEIIVPDEFVFFLPSTMPAQNLLQMSKEPLPLPMLEILPQLVDDKKMHMKFR
jgi:hypothetical protein